MVTSLVYMFNRLWLILIPSRLALTILLVGGEKRHREYMSNDHLWIVPYIRNRHHDQGYVHGHENLQAGSSGQSTSTIPCVYVQSSIICDAYNFVPYRNFYLRNTGIKVTVTFTRIRRRVRVVNLQMQYRVYTIFNDLPVWGIFKLLILSRLGGLAPTILHTPSIMMFPILVLVHWQAGINMIWMQISQCEYILWSVTNINYWFHVLL